MCEKQNKVLKNNYFLTLFPYLILASSDLDVTFSCRRVVT